MKLLSVVGARPNFMKLAPVARALAAQRDITHRVVHTGQHYDAAMSDVFFRDLRLAPPDRQLAVGAGPASRQTAAILERLDAVFDEEAPDGVLVYGDVTSTLAAALAAAQRRIPVAHVEAGLRSGDRDMPEELNRVLADHACDRLYAPSVDAVANLRREGIPSDRICFAGNVMIDTLIRALPSARRVAAYARFGAERSRYVVATFHRPANVDEPATLAAILGALAEIARDRDVIMPVHPRTRERIAALGTVVAAPRLHLVDPLGYVEMLSVVDAAALVLTDSGGLQEETTFLGVPCITVRPSTERPVTVEHGTNQLVAADRDAILAIAAVRLGASRRGERPLIEKWDGRAGMRIATDIAAGHLSREQHDPAVEALVAVV